MEELLTAVIGFAIFGVIIYYKAQKKGKLMGEGLIRERTGSFDREAIIFTTSVDFVKLWNKLNGMEYNTTTYYKLSQNSHTVNYNGARWEGILREVGKSEDKYRYQFNFTTWQTQYGKNTETVEMNLFLTSLEKAFLSLDPEVSVEKRLLKVKSKLF